MHSSSNSKLGETRGIQGFEGSLRGFEKIYTAPSAEIGLENLSDFAEKWNDKYAYIQEVGVIIGSNCRLFGPSLMKFED